MKNFIMFFFGIRMGAFGLPKPKAETRYSDAFGIRMGAFVARYSDAGF
jgi:hypothetical protein